MNAGKQTKMLRGAVWACVIPVGLGVIGLILLLKEVVLVASVNADYWSDIFLSLPIIACFILGAPLSAWLACRSLKKIQAAEILSRWRSSASRGVLSASFVHLVWSSLYIAGFLFFILKINSGSQRDSFSIMLLGFTATNLFIWLIITLPLSLLCSTIFWKITKFPENTDVF